MIFAGVVSPAFESSFLQSGGRLVKTKTARIGFF